MFVICKKVIEQLHPFNYRCKLKAQTPATKRSVTRPVSGKNGRILLEHEENGIA